MENASTDKLDEGIKEFIEKFAIPRVCPDCVIKGDQNAVLPDGDSLIVFTLLNAKRLSTTDSFFPEGMNAKTFRQYNEVTFQIDIYGDNSFNRASCLEQMARSYPAHQLLSGYGLDALYTSPIQNLAGVVDDSQYSQRWMFTFTLGYCQEVEVAQSYFTEINPELIEINSHFRKKE